MITGERGARKPARPVREETDGKGPQPTAPRRRSTSLGGRRRENQQQKRCQGVPPPTQHVHLDSRGAELLFQVLTEREEENAVAIASNDSFSGWTKTFTDPRLCAAIVDRLTFGGNIIETGSSSYRLAHARTQRQQGGATSNRHPGAKSS